MPIALFSMIAILAFGWMAYVHVTRVTDTMLQSEARAQHMAGHDALSGLPNRLRFTEHLAALLPRCGEDGRGIAVMFIDLDKFKEVNDTYGHAPETRSSSAAPPAWRGNCGRTTFLLASAETSSP